MEILFLNFRCQSREKCLYLERLILRSLRIDLSDIPKNTESPPPDFKGEKICLWDGLLYWLIFKNGFVGDIAFSGKEEIFTKSPLALF